MRIAVIGCGGMTARSILVVLAMQEVGRVEMLCRHPGVVLIDEFQHLPRIDQMEMMEEESPHPGERHRDAVRRVNSARSRAGKAARWS